MKKLLLSIGLIGLFVFYAVEQKQQPAATVQVSGNSSGSAQATTLPAPTAGAAAAGDGSSPRVGQLINITGTIYLVGQNGLYGIPTMAIFNAKGYSLNNVVPANSAESALSIVGIISANNQVAASPTPTPVSTGQYKDGTYTGSVANAFYGNLQVAAVISGGKLTDVQFLTYPNDRSHSTEVNQQALPILKSEAIAAQNANVDIVSGATQSSKAFEQSLGDALAQAM